MKFTVYSKNYRTPDQLTHMELGLYKSPDMFHREMPVYRDIHGRMVIHLSERFPCFDVYDRLYENRYYHYYYVKCEEGIAEVYTADDRDEVKVTELDLSRLSNELKEEFQAVGWMK